MKEKSSSNRRNTAKRAIWKRNKNSNKLKRKKQNDAIRNGNERIVSHFCKCSLFNLVYSLSFPYCNIGQNENQIYMFERKKAATIKLIGSSNKMAIVD